jgi:hypothetical protein
VAALAGVNAACRRPAIDPAGDSCGHAGKVVMNRRNGGRNLRNAGAVLSASCLIAVLMVVAVAHAQLSNPSPATVAARRAYDKSLHIEYYWPSVFGCYTSEVYSAIQDTKREIELVEAELATYGIYGNNFARLSREQAAVNVSALELILGNLKTILDGLQHLPSCGQTLMPYGAGANGMPMQTGPQSGVGNSNGYSGPADGGNGDGDGGPGGCSPGGDGQGDCGPNQHEIYQLKGVGNGHGKNH